MSQKYESRRLTQLKKAVVRNKIIGFDIETADDNKTFLCASFYSEDYQKTIFTKEEIKEELLNRKIYHNAYIGATNLSFDFFGSVFGQAIEKQFKLLFRGSDLIFAKTYIHKGKFYPTSKIMTDDGIKHAETHITFIDSMNFTKMSVKSLGEWIGLPKLEFFQDIGLVPDTPEKWEKLIEYNMRDAEITQKAISKLFDGFIQLGAQPRLTIASTGMDLFRRRFLDTIYYCHEKEDLYELFRSYYGGRTEAFKRGTMQISDDEFYNYYDFNSLYPFCMTKELPDPNTHHRIEVGNIHNIFAFEGCSDVVIFCPEMRFPVLPVKYEGKLLFPTGTIKGVYNHNEIRYAVSCGYQIQNVGFQHIFKKTCYPFKSYVDTLYPLRLKLKEQKDPLEMIVKILLNSLYGKTAQRFFDRETIIHETQFIEEAMLNEGDTFERVGEYVRILKKEEKPSVFCFPEWASYITSYARIHLHETILKCDPVYCDTDSLITKKELYTDKGLGFLKLEMKITEGIIIKPKFYAFLDEKDKEYIKIKGVHKKIIVEGNSEIYKNEILPMQKNIDGQRIDVKISGFQQPITMSYMKDNIKDDSLEFNLIKFMKFREAIRRGRIPNEIIPVMKKLDLEDSKRHWSKKFSLFMFQDSSPLNLDELIARKEDERNEKLERRNNMIMRISKKKELNKFIHSDLFDINSVGKDITAEEFIENEKFFALHD